jgi:hypothetical protein
MSSAQAERRISENIPRPGAAQSRHHDGIDPVIFVKRLLGLDDAGLTQSAGELLVGS